jgi:hypothetical protein
MLLKAFKTEGPIEGHDDRFNTGILGRRWALQVYGDSGAVYLGLEFQCKYELLGWKPAGEYYVAGVNLGLWQLGHTEAEYDGVHHSISLGPLFVAWMDCKSWSKSQEL